MVYDPYILILSKFDLFGHRSYSYRGSIGLSSDSITGKLIVEGGGGDSPFRCRGIGEYDRCEKKEEVMEEMKDEDGEVPEELLKIAFNYMF